MQQLHFLSLLFALTVVNVARSESNKVKRVAIGDSLKLICNVQTNVTLKETKFKWFSGLDLLAQSQSLAISDAQLYDAGIYRCESESITDDGNVIKQEESTELIVGGKTSVDGSSDDSFSLGGGSGHDNVALLPKIQIKGQNQSDPLKIFETMKLPLTCAVFTSVPRDSYTIQWTKPNKQKVEGNVLLIDKVLRNRDAGTYTCTATHKKGATASATLSVSIEELPLRITSSSNEVLESGGLISRECFVNIPVTKLVEEFDYIWVKNGIVISNRNPLILPIQDTTQQSGEYKCLAQGRTTKAKMEATSNVQIVNKIDEEFSLVLTQDPPEVSIGDQVKFNAKVTPDLEKPKFSWKFKNNVVSQTEVYILKSFQERNAGLYTCNVVGFDKKTKSKVHLQTAINSKLSNKIDMNLIPAEGKTITVYEGSKQELLCKYSGTDKTPQWSYSREILDDESFKNISIERIDQNEVSILSFRNVRKSHEGQYECLMGDKTLKVFMKVLQTKVILNMNPVSMNSIAGDGPVEFQCLITSSHSEVKNSDLKWWFQVDENNVQQLDMTRWTRKDSPDASSSITLKKVQFEDKGSYICTAPGGQKTSGSLTVNRPKGKDSLEVILTPGVIRVRSHQRVRVDCLTNMDYKPYGQPSVTFKNGTALDNNFEVDKTQEGRTRIEVPNGFGINQNGTIIKCEIDGKSAEAKILVELDGCHPGQRICLDGSKCLEMGLFCDGKADCRDKSDEDPSYCTQCDPINKKCESVSGNKPENPYYQAQWACDGEDDCGNGYDEQSCPDAGSSGCDGSFYTCKNENKKIPQAFLCDLETDCKLGDDEENCTAAEIFNDKSSPIQQSFELKPGSKITINCTAKGYPRPRIIWRANWGCLPDSGRVKVITETKTDCRTVVSSLTISSFQPGDDVVYNCEALTSRSRAFSKDFSLRLA